MHSVVSSSHRPSHRKSGSSLVPVLIIVSGLLISALIFFMFTRKRIGGSGEQAIAENQSAQAPASITGASGEPLAPKVREPAAPVAPATAASTPPSAPTPQVGLGFARPLDLGTQLARSLGSGDLKAASNLASAGNPTQAGEAAAVLEKIFNDLGYKVGAEDKVELLGLVENFTRLSIPLVKPGDPNANLRLQIDLERDEKMGWKISKMHLPKELSSALAALPQVPSQVPSQTVASGVNPPAAAPGPTGGTVAAMPKGASLFTIAETADALTFARDFVQALLSHDFVTARKFIEEQKVPAQKLAGLCIVFEEGQYALKTAKPLIITVANPEVSWVIAQVESEALQQSTEFGLELQRRSAADEWRVVGLNLSEILSSFAQSASKLGVPYTPLVKNPKGGESLALYFEYDRAELHPRAQKQLEIVAGLLKSNTNRKLDIAGYTDAKGRDEYNIRLSQARAETVKKQLVALGVPADQVITTAMGKAQPLGPNRKADGSDDPEGRSRNRRAEIFLDF